VRRREAMARLALVAVLLAGWSTTGLAADIQVACEPGLRVFLDGTLVGTSSAKEDGLSIAGVSEGRHVVRVEKDRFVPQRFEVQVGKLPVEVKVAAFVPVPPGAHESEGAAAAVARPGGNLVVISVPQNCDVEIDGKTELKTIPVLRIEGLTVGDHTVSFSRPGYEPISKSVWIGPGTEVTVRGDLKAGKVELVFEGMGSLRVMSTPNHIALRFLGKTYDKTDAKLNVSHIPSGKHRLVASWGGRELSSDVLILANQRTVVTVSFTESAEPFAVSYQPQ
jgi:hypothetical protein